MHTIPRSIDNFPTIVVVPPTAHCLTSKKALFSNINFIQRKAIYLLPLQSWDTQLSSSHKSWEILRPAPTIFFLCLYPVLCRASVKVNKFCHRILTRSNSWNRIPCLSISSEQFSVQNTLNYFHLIFGLKTSSRLPRVVDFYSRAVQAVKVYISVSEGQIKK